jgi:hypothetical protein
MSTLESDLLQADRQGDNPPPEPVKEEPAVAAAPVDDDAALDKLIEEQSIALPDGEEKLVPLSAVTTLREKLSTAKGELKTAKEGSAKQAELEDRVNQLTATLTQWKPYVEAYNAAIQQQQHQPAPAPAEDTKELEEVARDYDFYKQDGTLDLDKARRHNARVEKQAAKIAEAKVRPYADQTVADRAHTMRERAKNTVFASGEKADPAVVDMVWQQLDPAITATEAGAKFALIQAYGMSRMGAQQPQAQQRGPNGQFQPKEQLPPPLYTEKAGGKDSPGDIVLSDSERKAMKAMGMTEKEYLESAKTMPRGAR